MPNILLVLTVLFVLSIPPLALSSSAVPKLGAPVVVLAGPWGPSAAEIIDTAGGVQTSPLSTRLAAFSTNATESYLADLYKAQAFWVLDASRVAKLCGV